MMVEIVGLEPMTFCMSSKRSNQLSYTSVYLIIIPYIIKLCNYFFWLYAIFFSNLFFCNRLNLSGFYIIIVLRIAILF